MNLNYRVVNNMGSMHDGWLVIDKPLHMTSRDVVDQIVSRFPRKTRVGHAGTLDPLATGVLVIAVGKATRLVEYVQQMTKTYSATIQLGATSVTDDSEGPIETTVGAIDPGRDAVEAAIRTFIGDSLQAPPAYSAAKVAGRRAYKISRAGRMANPTAKLVHIESIEVVSYQYPWLDVTIHCGKGTYVRSLARDLGAKLAVGGYVQSLRRESIGDFSTQQATSLESSSFELLPLEIAINALPRIELQTLDAQRFCHGQAIRCATNQEVGQVACYESRTLLGLGRLDADQVLSPKKILI